MATSTRTTRAKTDEKPAETTAPAPSFAVKASAVSSFTNRSSKPNPLSGAVAASKDNPQMIEVTGPDQAAQVTSYLRRDAADNDSGVRILYTDGNGKALTGKEPVKSAAVRQVHFTWKPRSKRNYTTADIAAWYKETYGETMPEDKTRRNEVREEFKKANGYGRDAKKD